MAERALQPFFSGSADRVCLQGGVWLQPGPALTMALVFHELATNAVKYGALSTDKGRVDITWTFDEADERLRLIWAASEGPPVAPPTRVGFGSRLIQRGLQGDLRGSAILRYDPGGLICAMDARLPGPAATKPAA